MKKGIQLRLRRKLKPKIKFEPKMKTLIEKLWALVRQVVFAKYGTDCYTCDQKKLKGINLQCGHAYPKGALGVSMQYDIRILRPQCFHCNINLGGCGVIFWKNLERDLGKEEADKLYDLCRKSKGEPIKARPFVLELIKKFSTT